MKILSEFKNLPVYKDIAYLAIKYGPKIGLAENFANEVDGSPNKDKARDQSSNSAESFAKDLESLGPAYIKLGQLLSTRADLFPADWLKALQKLQDDIDPLPFEVVEEILEQELGVKPSKIFSSIEEKPIGSASLGQVHKATLRSDGTTVAVKAQRPEACKQAVRDLRALVHIAEELEKRHELLQKYRIHAIALEARKRIQAELDYESEATSLDRLHANLSDYSNIMVPMSYPAYSSKKVLTMDYVDGQRISDMSGVVMVDIDGSKLATELFESYLKQVLIDGFFHADPHPGNVLLTQDRKLSLIDMGMVGYTSHELRNLLLNLLVSIAEQDGDTVADVSAKIGTPAEDFDRKKFTSDICDLVSKGASSEVGGMRLGDSIMQIMRSSADNGLIIPQEMYLIGKMLLNLDMVGKQLDPEFRPDQVVQNKAAILTYKRIKETVSSGNAFSLLMDAKELLADSPKRINRIMGHLADNNLRLNIDAVDEKLLINGIEKIANRITCGVIIGAMLLGSSLLMLVESEHTLWGYPGLAVIMMAIAIIGGVILIWRLTFEGNQ